MARPWRRYALRGILATILLLAAALAAAPWWWPAVARKVAGFDYARSIASGWSTIELQDVTLAREGIEISASSLRVPAFGLWPSAGDDAMVVAENVVVRLRPQPNKTPAPPSAYRLVRDILRAWPTIEQWVPSAQVNGLEVVPVGEDARPVRIESVHWDGAQIAVQGPVPGRDEGATVTLERPEDDTLRLSAGADALQTAFTATARAGDDLLEVEAAIDWRGNHAEAHGSFGPTGLFPRRATVRAPELSVPSALLGLPGYGPITGGIDATWNQDAYTAEVTAQAAPTDNAADLPPLAVELRAGGDLERVRIDAATVRIPGVDAELSAPLELALPRGVPAAPAQFALEADLAKIPPIAASGRIAGRVDISAGAGEAAAAEFVLTGEDIHWREADVPSLNLEGRWQPDRVVVRRARVRLGEDEEVRAEGEIDLRDRSIVAATVSADVSAEPLRAWVPQVPSFTRLQLDAQASGPWQEPEHRGTAAFTGLAGAPGGAVDGRVTWTGRGAATVALDATMQSEAGIEVPVAAEVERAADGTITASVNTLSWRDDQGEWWKLAQPARVRLAAGGGVAVDGLHLAGAGLDVTLTADIASAAQGSVVLNATSVPAARLAPLLGGKAYPAVLERAELHANWERGPVRLDGSVRASYSPREDTTYAVEAVYRSETADLVFGAIRVYGATGPVLQGEGRLPLRLEGGEEGFQFRLPRDGEISLQLDSTPNPEFWDALASTTGWRVLNPEVRARLHGTLEAPQGDVRLTAGTIAPPAELADAVRLPELSELRFVAAADGEGVQLEQGIWKVDGNWVSLNGRAPWSVFQAARDNGGVAWRDLEFSFAADRLPMVIASRVIPRVLAPDGTLSFKVDHAPDSGFAGFLWLDSVGLRPIQPVGAVRDVGGTLLLNGYELVLRNVAAYLGGRPVQLGGRADLSDPSEPTFDLRLLSSNVPLVRQEGIVLRTGLNLRVQREAGSPAKVTGSADLGRSVFVSELVGLLPTNGGVEQPEQRPPYFSVEAQPFADWELDVTLAGENFLQVQNPFFRSEVSADFRLTGTLQEPRAQGRAWADQGTIIFPFGSLAVQQLEVTLSPENPYMLALRGTAVTRLYGYDIRMNVSGSAQDPRLQFTSEPPLSSQQVFLMLSAGEMPEEEHAFTTSERARRLGMFVARNLASTFGLGGGTGEQRLTVRSGEDFSREGSETIYVQYDLDERWSLVGEKDRFDEYNAGVKFRIIDR